MDENVEGGALAASIVIISMIPILLYLYTWPDSPYLLLGVIGIILAIAIAILTLSLPRGQHPRALRIAVFLIILNLVFLVINLLMIGIHFLGFP
jgi:uncharacterized membrane protein